MVHEDFSVVYSGNIVRTSQGNDGNDRRHRQDKMDKPRHPQVIRTWKVERIRKAANTQRAKSYKPKAKNKSK